MGTGGRGAVTDVDVAVVGGGQAGIATGYFLRRAGADFVVLDDRATPGGAWTEYWDSLRLFSPAGHSMLPGWWMPPEEGHEYPSAHHVVWYLTEYERRYRLPVHRPVTVERVERENGHDLPGGRLRVVTDRGTWRARHVISATGNWSAPHLPSIPGREVFAGRELHTVDYRGPDDFAGQRVVVVGGGNSAAQIIAELSLVADTTWVAARPPRFMPDDVDARALFDLATRRGRGEEGPGVGDLGDIVVVPSVREARERGALKAEPMIERLTPGGVAWPDGSTLEADAVLWCTGFRPALGHLVPLGVDDGHGRVRVGADNRAVAEPRLSMVGYGDWTGFASATIIGAGRTAKSTVAAVTEALEREGRV
ncbi:NAD(P)/FAD-dependent oxidoreductase [Nocardiopsis sp. HNM0947]|uniref:NAD(P)/FAD-dependent oxidoreductase n=1 Tax=Nocardiopsis coralli TaxID=2772213 RepID=A0ABR9P2I4_9ACTN|nr:ArsO family NAD(P)H-dependent flavin-containing monooxygenase [Nocardiopsis coralli]MBE2998053.1 NAD(P)/FAD-dependent oxidoreductase [Nocardiopsis coralli]